MTQPLPLDPDNDGDDDSADADSDARPGAFLLPLGYFGSRLPRRVGGNVTNRLHPSPARHKVNMPRGGSRANPLPKVKFYGSPGRKK